MQNDFTCIIIDDEQYAVELLRDRISKLYKKVNVVNTYLFWEDALAALREQHFDLVFMDISMPGKNGIDILKLLPNLQSEVIFVTAYEQYALEAFSVSASGYILKPINDGALSAALDKAIERTQTKRLAKQPAAAAPLVAEKMGIPNTHGIDYVNVADILYLETINKCTKIVTRNAEFISSYQIGKFKDHVSSYPFFQVHRSYIINLNFMLRYETSGVVVMNNKKEIPLSRNVKNDFLAVLNSNFK